MYKTSDNSIIKTYIQKELNDSDNNIKITKTVSDNKLISNFYNKHKDKIFKKYGITIDMNNYKHIFYKEYYKIHPDEYNLDNKDSSMNINEGNLSENDFITNIIRKYIKKDYHTIFNPMTRNLVDDKVIREFFKKHKDEIYKKYGKQIKLDTYKHIFYAEQSKNNDDENTKHKNYYDSKGRKQNPMTGAYDTDYTHLSHEELARAYKIFIKLYPELSFTLNDFEWLYRDYRKHMKEIEYDEEYSFYDYYKDLYNEGYFDEYKIKQKSNNTKTSDSKLNKLNLLKNTLIGYEEQLKRDKKDGKDTTYLQNEISNIKDKINNMKSKYKYENCVLNFDDFVNEKYNNEF